MIFLRTNRVREKETNLFNDTFYLFIYFFQILDTVLNRLQL